MTAALGYGLYLLPGVAQLAWAARLRGLRLLSSYPSLALYLLFSTLSSLLVLTAHYLYRGSEAYGWFFVVTQPVGWTLLLCVVLEIYQRMIRGYEGLDRMGRLVMYGAVGALAVVLTFLLLLDKPDGALGQWRNFWFRQERSVYLGLCGLSVVLAGFGAYFHLRVGRTTHNPPEALRPSRHRVENPCVGIGFRFGALGRPGPVAGRNLLNPFPGRRRGAP